MSSDRASAIVSVAYLEDQLTKAIKANLRDDEDAANRLLKPTGPLGPLGNKLQIGYLLHLYSKEFRDDLGLLAEVRNMFAHWGRPLHFGYKDVRKKVEGIGFLLRMFKEFPGGKKPPFERDYARFVFYVDCGHDGWSSPRDRGEPESPPSPLTCAVRIAR